MFTSAKVLSFQHIDNPTNYVFSLHHLWYKCTIFVVHIE